MFDSQVAGVRRLGSRRATSYWEREARRLPSQNISKTLDDSTFVFALLFPMAPTKARTRCHRYTTRKRDPSNCQSTSADRGQTVPAFRKRAIVPCGDPTCQCYV